MILIATVIYFSVASLFVASITFVAARPMPKPPDVNDQKNELLRANPASPRGPLRSMVELQ